MEESTLLHIEAEKPKRNNAAYSFYVDALRPLEKFADLEEFLAKQMAYNYSSARTRAKLEYCVNCNVCGKTFKYVPAFIAHCLLPDCCPVLTKPLFSNPKITECNLCNSEVAEDSLCFHNYSRHLSCLMPEKLEDQEDFIEDLLRKYVVICCDRCKFSVKTKYLPKQTMQMFLRHWMVCKDYPYPEVLTKQNLICDGCQSSFTFVQFVRHDNCGAYRSSHSIDSLLTTSASISEDSPKPAKRISLARAINFNDIYGEMLTKDVESKPSKDADFVPVEDSGIMEADETPTKSSRVSSCSTPPFTQNSTNRRHFTRTELVSQHTAYTCRIMELSSWRPVFPSYLPVYTLSDCEVSYVPNEITGISAGKHASSVPEMLSSVSIAEGCVLNVGTPLVSSDILRNQELGFYSLIVSCKINRDKRYPVSEINTERHYLQVWSFTEDNKCPSSQLSQLIEVSGLCWQLKYMTHRKALLGRDSLLLAASSSGKAFIMAISSDRIISSRAASYRCIALAPRTSYGQCICVDYQYFSDEVTRVIAGFSDGSVAIFNLDSHSNAGSIGDEQVEIHPTIVLAAHNSYVESVAWNFHNPYHFASQSPMIEDSLKIWNSESLDNGPVLATSLFQFVRVSSDWQVSGFVATITHSNVRKSTFPTSIIILEEEQYGVNSKYLFHDKLCDLTCVDAINPIDTLSSFAITEEGYVLGSESRFKLYGKKEKVSSCRVLMSVSVPEMTKSLHFQESRVQISLTHKFPSESSILSTVCACKAANSQDVILSVGTKSGFVRIFRTRSASDGITLKSAPLP